MRTPLGCEEDFDKNSLRSRGIKWMHGHEVKDITWVYRHHRTTTRRCNNAFQGVKIGTDSGQAIQVQSLVIDGLDVWKSAYLVNRSDVCKIGFNVSGWMMGMHNGRINLTLPAFGVGITNNKPFHSLANVSI